LELAPGRHEIAIGETRLEVHVRGDGEALEAPDGWPVYRSHQGSTEGWEDCSICHEVTKDDDLTVVGELKQAEACYECHSAIDFEATHFHPREPLDACNMCHELHGASGPSLLKGEVKKLCAECHE
jgi:predicted CXXCH cytochrome family protein